MGENTRCFKRKKGFVYGQRATHTISVISVGDTVSQRSRRAAEAQRRGGGERLLYRSFTVRFQQSTSAPSKHRLTRITACRFGPLVRDKVHISSALNEDVLREGGQEGMLHAGSKMHLSHRNAERYGRYVNTLRDERRRVTGRKKRGAVKQV